MVTGVSGRVLEKIVAAAIDRYGDLVPEVLSPALRARLALPAIGAALRTIHARPGSWSDDADDALVDLTGGRSPAHRRIAFEDLLIVQLGLAAGRRQARAGSARACVVDGARARGDLEAALPFALTAGQGRAIDEIARDLAAAHPMQRLLVGDVGSGKTVVAFAAAAIAAAAGGQTLLMAPTEVLVEQHLRTLGALAAELSRRSGVALRVARFTASMPRAERAETLARCRAGAVELLIGTQALLEAPPSFADLRLAIVDEQHRFGVAQRARLRRGGADADAARATAGGDSGDGDRGAAAASGARDALAGGRFLPHLLVMSATPIPRTLALTLYGDLDVTFLREGPPGRPPTETEIFAGDERRAAAHRRLEEAIGEGRQAYVVCPVRASSARAGAVTAVARAAELRRALGGRGVRVGLLHGELDAGRERVAPARLRHRNDRRAGRHHRGRARHRRPQRDGDAGRGGRPLRPGAAASAARAGRAGRVRRCLPAVHVGAAGVRQRRVAAAGTAGRDA